MRRLQLWIMIVYGLTETHFQEVVELEILAFALEPQKTFSEPLLWFKKCEMLCLVLKDLLDIWISDSLIWKAATFNWDQFI